jgi:hypothetical protein
MQPKIDWKLISSTGYDPPDKGWLEQAWDDVKNTGEATYDAVKDVTEGTYDAASGILDDVRRLLFSIPVLGPILRWLDKVGTGVFVFVVDAVVTLVSVVVVIVESVLGPLLNPLAGLLERLFSIPLIGPILQWIWHVAVSLVWEAVSAIDFVLALLGILPEKKLRLLVIIQEYLDETFTLTPVASLDRVMPQISLAIKVFNEQANVRVLPVQAFQFSSGLEASPSASLAYVHTENKASSEGTLECACGGTGFAQDVDLNGSISGSAFNTKMIQDCSEGNFRRLVGYGAPICAFALKNFTDDHIGCSLGPLTDYILIDFNKDPNPSDLIPSPGIGPGLVRSLVRASDGFYHTPSGLYFETTLAHEMGHACNLWHVDPPNLMSAGPQRPLKLSRFQIALLRTSRHVTYF